MTNEERGTLAYWAAKHTRLSGVENGTWYHVREDCPIVCLRNSEGVGTPPATVYEVKRWRLKACPQCAVRDEIKLAREASIG